jgi:hypothetical protein
MDGVAKRKKASLNKPRIKGIKTETGYADYSQNWAVGKPVGRRLLWFSETLLSAVSGCNYR